MIRRLKQIWCGRHGHPYPPITIPLVGRAGEPETDKTFCRNCSAELYTEFADNAGAERIRSFNGRSGDPADPLVWGCLGIVGAFFFIMIFCAVLGPYLP